MNSFICIHSLYLLILSPINAHIKTYIEKTFQKCLNAMDEYNFLLIETQMSSANIKVKSIIYAHIRTWL